MHLSSNELICIWILLENLLITFNLNRIFNTPTVVQLEINTVNPSFKRGFPFDQSADCWFPTWDPFVCAEIPRDQTHTRHKHTKGSVTANIEQSEIEEMLHLWGGLHRAVAYASLCICTSPGQNCLFPWPALHPSFLICNPFLCPSFHLLASVITHGQIRHKKCERNGSYTTQGPSHWRSPSGSNLL